MSPRHLLKKGAKIVQIDVLVAEIGSTTTVVNAFDGIKTNNPRFLGQGQAPTSVLAGDVRIGLTGAIANLQTKLKICQLKYREMFATSSAAGGLRMSVHGLVFDMTVRAAKEAALGAGAIVYQVTAGRLRTTDLKKLGDLAPNIILLAGGVDYGERETALANAKQLAQLGQKIPIIYAGNVENQAEIALILKDYPLYVVDNVFPRIDELNVEPARRVIQEVFEKNIIHAPGMEAVFEMVTEAIMPTPGAVMEASKLIQKQLGDVLVLDVGGATTDVHSVTAGCEKLNQLQISPEAMAKRTVEGDLGVYVNAANVAKLIGAEQLAKAGFNVESQLADYQFIPKTPQAKKFVLRLTEEAVMQAVNRHVGKIRHVYGPTGRRTLVQGKDLTQVKYLIGTGGALTQLDGAQAILEKILTTPNDDLLLPKSSAKVLLDHDYTMASLGVLASKYEEASLLLLKKSLIKA